MIYLKGSGFTNAAQVKEVSAEQKDYSHISKKCYYCNRSHSKKGSLICGECKKPEKLEHPKIILKGNGWVKTSEFQRNNVDKDTGQVVEKKHQFSFKNYD